MMNSIRKKYVPLQKEIFHVHTYRCRHAGDDPDEAYVKKAIELNMDRIVFTDHVPFPGDPFGSRMYMSEYDGYIDSIYSLKRRYADAIEILCGFEVEYFPQYIDHYKMLRSLNTIDILLLGQHMYMHADGTYNFMDADRSDEYTGISAALVEGINTGLFDVVAHPDRMCMRHGKVDDAVIPAIKNVVHAAIDNDVLLEKNYSSMYREKNYMEDFWKYTENAGIIYGYDAHSVKNIDELFVKLTFCE